MKIEFMFHNVKDIALIYFKEEKFYEDWGSNVTEEKYLGTDYCKAIVSQLKLTFSEIMTYHYNGQTIRVAHEDYTIDTFNEKKQTQLLVQISSLADTDKYDSFLEKLKIFIKEILLKDWNICTWIVDEQSEYLGMKLYPLIFKTENKMRAFVNKVLTYKFGVKWMEMIGLEDIILGYKKSNVDFKRDVPEFDNINDFLICSTAESLTKLMLKSKVFEPAISFSDSESLTLHKMLSDKKANAIFEALLKSRTVKVDIWKDIFEKYFDGEVQKAITDFIKNRNHVAHNKLMTNASFEKMKQNIISVESMFDKAEELFLEEEPSDELYETWNAEQEEVENEKEYIQDRIKNETGISVLYADGIFDLFEEEIHKLYTAIDDSEYFSYAVNISALSNFQNEAVNQYLFSIKSNVDESFNIDVYVLFEIVEGMGEDSTMKLWVENPDKIEILKADVTYHNGEAHEDTLECYYVPDSESQLDNEALKKFVDEIGIYIRDDMNTIKAEANRRSYLSVKERGNPPVADFPCWNCNQNYISIDDELYPYGHCINCGEENEILKCNNCGNIYSSDEGGEYGGMDFCNDCLEKIDKE